MKHELHMFPSRLLGWMMAVLMVLIGTTAQADVTWPLSSSETYTVTLGSQVTSAADVEDGAYYVFYNPRNGCFMYEDSSNYQLKVLGGLNSSAFATTTNTITHVFKLTANGTDSGSGESTYLMQNASGRYMPKPTANGSIYTVESSSDAGSYIMNFSSDQIFPRCINGGSDGTTVYGLDHTTSTHVHAYTSLNTNAGNAQNYRLFRVTISRNQISSVNLTFNRSGSTVSDVTVNVKDGDGESILGVTAALESASVSAFQTTGSAAITNTTNSVLVPAPDSGYGNNNGDQITYTLKLSGLPASFSYDHSGVDVYASTSGGGSQSVNSTRNWNIDVQTGSTEAGLASFTSLSDKDITAGTTQNGIIHNVWETTGTQQNSTSPLWLKVVLTKYSGLGCFAGLGGVNLFNNDAVTSADDVIDTSKSYYFRNANGRGNMYYSPENSTSWVYSSGKSDAVATDAVNYQWQFEATGNADEFLIKNVGNNRYIAPVSGNNSESGYGWAFADTGEPVTVHFDTNTKKFYMTASSHGLSINNSWTGPMSDWTSAGSDEGEQFYLDATTTSVSLESMVGSFTAQKTSGSAYWYEWMSYLPTVTINTGTSYSNMTSVADHPEQIQIHNSNTNVVNISVPEFYKISGYEFDFTNPDAAITVTKSNGETVTMSAAGATAHVAETGLYGNGVTFTIGSSYIRTSNFTVSIEPVQFPTGTKVFDNANSSVPYRIPALARTADGKLFLFVDYRRSRADIGIGSGSNDFRYKVSTDNGATWSAEKVLAAGVDGSSTWNVCYGDAAAVADREDPKSMIVMGVAGSKSYWSSTNADPMNGVLFRTTDGGENWTETNLTSQIYGLYTGNLDGEDAAAMFFTSGRICQSRIIKAGTHYRLYLAHPIRRASDGSGAGKYATYVIYSDDFGATWQVLGGTNPIHSSASDESKVEELPDGSVILSCRNQTGGRKFNVFTYTDQNSAAGSWSTEAVPSNMTSGLINACNGEILIVPVTRKADNAEMWLALQSVPLSSSRKNVGFFYKPFNSGDITTGTQAASDWTRGLQVTGKNSCYSTMQLLRNATVDEEYGHVGFVYEETDYNGGYDIVFMDLTIDEITGGLYGYRTNNVDEQYVPYVAETEEPETLPEWVTIYDSRQHRFIYAGTDGNLYTSRTINHDNVNSASWKFEEVTEGSGHYYIYNKDGKYINPAGSADENVATTSSQPSGYWTLSESTVSGCEDAYTVYSSAATRTMHVLNYDDATHAVIFYGAEGNTDAGCQLFLEAVRTLPVISDNNSSTYYTIASERVDAYDSSASRASLKSPDVGAQFVGVALENTDINQQWKFTANTTSGYNVVSAGFAQYLNGDDASESGAKMSLTDDEPAAGWTIGYNWEGLYSISNGTQQLHVGGYNDSYQVLNWGGGTNFSDIGCKLHIEAAPAPVFNLTSGWYQIKVNNNPEYYLGSDEATVVGENSYTYTSGRVHVEKNSLRSRYVLNDEQWAFFQAQEGTTGNGKPESFVPLRLQSAAEKAMPADDDATYYIYVNVDESNNVQLRSSNGHWVGQAGFANYQTPMQTTSGQDSSFFTTNALHQFDSDGYGLGTKNLNGLDAYMTVWPSVVSDTYTDLIGETHNSTENMLYMNAGTTAIGDGNFDQTRYLLRKVNPADQGLTEWKVRTGVYPEDQVELTANLEYTYQHEAPHVTLTGVDAANVSGVTTAYLGGTFFMKNNTALTDDNLEAARATNYWDGIQRVKVVALADDGENQIMMFETYVGIIYAQAKEASDGVGIGYPKADHEARVALAATGVDFTTDVNAVTTSSFTDDQITDMIVYSELLLTESDITKLQMPEEGKAYTFRLVKKDGTKGNYLKNATLGSDLTGTSQMSIAAVPESGVIPQDGWFIGKKISDGTYAFVNIAGDYVTYINKDSNQNGVYGTTGAGSTYEVEVDGYGTKDAHLTLSKFPYEGSYITSTTPKDTYGLFMLSGYRKAKSADCPIIVKEDGLTFDNSDVPFFNGSFTSAFLCEETTPFLNQDVKVNNGGDGFYTTLYLPFPVELPEGATASIGKIDSDNATIDMTAVAAEDGSDVTVLPKNTPVVIKFDAQPTGGKYTFIPAITPGVSIEDDANDLAGTLVTIPKVDNAYTFQKVNGNLGFFRYTGATLKEGKAYVVFNNGGSMPGFSLFFNGNTTGIGAVEVSGGDGKFYDLSGRRVAQPQKGGVYILNGRKVFVK